MIGYSVFCFGYRRRVSLIDLSDGLVTVWAALPLTELFGAIGALVGVWSSR